MIRLCLSIALLLSLTACQRGLSGTQAPYQGPRTQGVYVTPLNQRPTPMPRIPAQDQCNARLYFGLVGRHEGSIYIPGLPLYKRILKPAFVESFDEDPTRVPPPPLLEVRDFIPDQTLYAPSIRTVSDVLQLGPQNPNRLTLELDRDGFVQDIRCE